VVFFHTYFLNFKSEEDVINAKHTNENIVTCDHFVQGIAQCVRSSSQTTLRTIFTIFARNSTQPTLTTIEMQQLMYILIAMTRDDLEWTTKDVNDAVHCSEAMLNTLMEFIEPPEDKTIKSMDSDSTISFVVETIKIDQFVHWCELHFPILYTVFTTWMAQKCFPSLAKPSYLAPVIPKRSDILTDTQFTLLSYVTKQLQGELDQIYTSTTDGLSFNRLTYHILGYPGPTLFIIRATDQSVFGMFCDEQWKDTRFHGGRGCFLFRFHPTLRICLPQAKPGQTSTEKFMYFNTKGSSYPRGIGMGGDFSSLRLFLSEDLDENCYTLPKCMNFHHGPLSDSKQFTIETMEVYGAGDMESRAKQAAHRKERTDLLNKARKVDKAQFVGNDFDREMFLGKTYNHGTNQARIADDES
jgi:hypothetical protein